MSGIVERDITERLRMLSHDLAHASPNGLAIIHAARSNAVVLAAAIDTILTLRASLAQAEARGMEKAAEIAEAHEGKPCRTTKDWTSEQSGFYFAGHGDASDDIASAIRAASRLALQESRDGE